VSYRSAGAVLVVGPAEAAYPVAGRLPGLNRTVLVTDGGGATTQPAVEAGLLVVHGRVARFEGHLGQFVAIVEGPNGPIELARLNGGERPHFDLVLDLGSPPLLGREMQPFGYYAPADAAALERALAELPEMVGEFEKPKFFSYNPDICAHGDSGLQACRRCIDACPAEAISSLGDIISVDPFLCQGGGSCATACPSGAITYAYPAPSDTLAAVRAMLKAYREAGGERPALLFHDAADGAEQAERLAGRLPEWVLPVQVEELGSVGMDVWLASIAYGAAEVALLATPAVPRKVVAEVDRQLGYAHALLEGMGYPSTCLRRVGDEGEPALLAQLEEPPAPVPIEPGTFAAFDEKRVTLRLALDHLYRYAPAPRAEVALPPGAPFGRVLVKTEACTLCMACPSVCPTGALIEGGEQPRLSFIEQNCVQCGLCSKACPEWAITLESRFVYDAEVRGATRVLNEEQPFCCIGCGKAFATPSVIKRMTERLKDHHMFRGEEALRRLQMCEECRVKDLFAAERAGERRVM
jgi:ferredoxin